ncbi:MAG: RluA family pseudouridine synthase [Clostridia bacterium]|nr:RluA family pseudouridine synthase [Clostridia bacterium]
MNETKPIESLRAGRFEIPVLYLDNHLLGVVKPPNMPVQADKSRDLDLLTALKGYIGEKFLKPGAVYLGLVHRLDRPVGGAMVFARTSKAAERLSRDFAGHDMEKRYLAVVRGGLAQARTLEDWLVKDEKTGMVRVCRPEEPGAKRARLVTTPIASHGGLTLVEVVLMTGRAHQIRVQHMNAGLPLWGDARYGGGKPGEQIALWAYRLAVTHPTLKTPVALCAAPPAEGAWRLFRGEMENLK